MLTLKERKWIEKLQQTLDACPSTRLGFYTTGDPQIIVYDKSKDELINARDDIDFCRAVEINSGYLAALNFPSQVHSTAG